MVSISMAAWTIFYLIVAGLIFWLFTWAIDAVQVPEPFNRVVKVLVILLAVFVVIGILLQLVTGQPVFRP